jgi:parallel beta-helix repeat protein
MLVWASTKTLEKVGDFETELGNLAGIVIDSDKELIYVIEREYPYLFYIYSFDEGNNTLILEGIWQLNPTTGHPTINGMGLALDENTNLLYVTSLDSNRVHIYDTDDFIGSGGYVDPNGYIDIVVGGVTPRKAVGIAVDPVRRFMYTAGFYGTGGYHNYLVRTQLDPPYASTEVLVGTGYGVPAVGIDVDRVTGYVYVTTQVYDFRVYDSNLNLLDVEWNQSIYTPAGVAVGGWYKTASNLLVKNNADPNNDCVYPYDPIEENYLVFDIYWDANGHPDTNVVLIDQLTDELDYDSSIPAGNVVGKTVTWPIGNIGTGNNSGHIVLTTKVNYWARPCDTITNTVIMEGDTYLNEAKCDVTVCPWGDEIIYVDWDANGFNNGTSWDDAYIDLQDALTNARNCGASVTAIWVAAGTYKPTQNQSDTDANYALIEDVALFGHFPPEGSYRGGPEDRNFADANNETILDGRISESVSVKYVVTSNGVKNALLDGFTVTGSYSDYEGAGIFLNDSNTAIVNCKIKNNHKYGAYITNFSYPDIHNCLFIDNYTVGIKCDGSSPAINNTIFDGNNTTFGGVAGYNSSVITLSDCIAKKHTESGIYGQQTYIEIENCCVTDNGFGIYCEYYSNATINNSLIKNNGYGTNNYYGVFCSDSDLIISRCAIENNNGQSIWCAADSSLDLTNSIIRWNSYDGVHLEDGRSATIKNNWIHNNLSDGIYITGQSVQPLVRNNTIVHNAGYGIYRDYSAPEPNISNCIIWGNTTGQLYNCTATYSWIIADPPGFMNIQTDPNDLHIAENSPCKNEGNPYGNYVGETDIDGEDRVKYGRVDIGADEYYLSPADFNDDLIVNFIDYTLFANVWQSNNADFSLDDDNDVDYNDLTLFCKDWLWQAGWTKTFTCGAGQDMSQTMAAGFIPVEVSYQSISPEQQVEKTEPLKIEELIDWLEKLWLDEESQNLIDEDVLLKFIESLKEDYKIH